MSDADESQSNTLVMTVGLPRSGKSTWARSKGYPIVCPDAVRLALHGGVFLPDAEKMVWAVAHYMVKALFFAGHHTVILDATNTTRERRSEWKSVRWRRRYKVMGISREECLSRAVDRPDLHSVIERMAAQFQTVDTDEWDEPITSDLPGPKVE